MQSVASMHLAAALHPFEILEHRHEHHDFMRGLASHVPEVEADGCVGLPPGPGLGIELNEDFARAHAEGRWVAESFRADGSIGDW